MKTKSFFITVLIFFSSHVLFAQSNNSEVQQPTKTTNYEYCEIVGTSANLLGTKLTIVIDFGQSRKFGQDLRLKDETGAAIKFNSMIDALNFMGDGGWEFVQAYAITMGNTNVYHFLLKKEITELKK